MSYHPVASESNVLNNISLSSDNENNTRRNANHTRRNARNARNTRRNAQRNANNGVPQYNTMRKIIVPTTYFGSMLGYGNNKTGEDEFEMFLQNYRMISERGFAPRMVNVKKTKIAGSNNQNVTISMEKMKTSLKEYCSDFLQEQYKLSRVNSKNGSNSVNRSKLQEIHNRIKLFAIQTANDVCKNIKRLHDTIKICHNDINVFNVMLSMDNDWTFINYDLAGKLNIIVTEGLINYSISTPDTYCMHDYASLINSIHDENFMTITPGGDKISKIESTFKFAFTKTAKFYMRDVENDVHGYTIITHPDQI